MSNELPGADDSGRTPPQSESSDRRDPEGAGNSPPPEPLGFARRAFGDFLRDLEPELPPNTRIDDYVVERTLGTGGMGRVYLARRESPKGPVAIKVSLSGSSAALRRFEIEARAMGMLQHPNIPSVYQATRATVRLEPGGTAFQAPILIMDFVPGARDLRSWIAETRPPLAVRLGVFVEICKTVAYAHGQGVVHRDLTPRNILIDAEGRVRIIDFGIAFVEKRGGPEVTQVDELLGTPGYLPPEQARGTIFARKPTVDVWALGVILHEMISEKRLFDARSIASAQGELHEHNDPPPLPRSAFLSEGPFVGSGLREDLNAILAKALRSEERDRYPSASELASEIENALEGRPVRAHVASRRYRVRCWLRRRSPATLAMITLGLGFLLLAGVAYGTWWNIETVLARGRSQLIEEQYTVLREEGMWELLWGSPALGIRRLSEAREIWPNAPDADRNLAFAYLHVADHARAIETIDAGPLPLDPAHALLRETAVGLALHGGGHRPPIPDVSTLRTPDELVVASWMVLLTSSPSDSSRFAMAADMMWRASLSTHDPIFLLDTMLVFASTRADTRWLLELLPDFLERRWGHRRETPFFVGTVYAACNRWEDAQQAYERARRLGFEHPRLASNSALVLTHLGRLDEAESKCHDALEQRRRIGAEGTAIALNGLGIVAHQRGARARAEGAADDIVETHLREAAYWFEEAGATYPRYGTAFDNLGQVYGALGLYREAESAFRTAHETNPEHGGHRYDLAAYLMNRGNMLTAECRISEAKSMLTEGVSLYPHGRGYYLLGRALIESGEIGEAKAAFEKALQTDPVQPDARIELDRLARLDRSTR